MTPDFVECPKCAAEPGTPQLCAACVHNRDSIFALQERVQDLERPIPMLIKCPECGARHYDEGEFAHKPHHTHSCQSCGWTWRPAVVNTVGVRFHPGYKNP